MKKAFTLIEMLVVIGIIGILAATLAYLAGGTSDSARAAVCKTNMRQLGAAFTSAAMENYCVTAGSREVYGEGDSAYGDDNHAYDEQRGWISWDSQGKYVGEVKSSKSPSSSWYVSAYATDDTLREYCLTNGGLWASAGKNSAIYTCPYHIYTCKKKGRQTPLFSYVMNRYFGWQSQNNYTYQTAGSIVYSDISHPERRLLFAELPFVEISGVQSPNFSSGSGTRNDSVLQYGDSYNEGIGFNHKSGKDYFAHVCYVDGHVGEIRLAKNANSSKIQELTEWLCKAKDVQITPQDYKLFEGEED